MLPEYYVIKNSCTIEMENLLYGSQTSFVIWSKVLVNQEDSSPKVDDSRDGKDLMDVLIYETG